jgi:hypothetical protein
MKEVFVVRQVFTNGYWDGVNSFRGLINVKTYETYDQAKQIIADLHGTQKYVSIMSYFQIDKMFKV